MENGLLHIKTLGLMYRSKRNSIQTSLEFDEFLSPFGNSLSKDNRWVILANLIPWDLFEDDYSNNFGSTGFPALPFRVALGSLIIKERLGLSDVEVVAQIKENPYLQYFLGYTSFLLEAPFDDSSLTHFRKRINKDVLCRMNEFITGKKMTSESDNALKDLDTVLMEKNSSQPAPELSGKLIVDATCAPEDIRFPTDIALLNDARVITETVVDHLWSIYPNRLLERKPRTHRKSARKLFLHFIRQKKPGSKKLYKALKAQLQFIGRNLSTIDSLKEQVGLRALKTSLYQKLLVSSEVYRQQLALLKTFGTIDHNIPDRIVSIHKPHVRPIVRGKAGASCEFGSKASISVVGGNVYLDKLSWDNYNEGTDLKVHAMRYYTRNGFLPASIHVDKIFLNRENRKWCQERGIRLSGKPLGRPVEDEKMSRAKKRELRQDELIRIEVEGKFGVAKRKYSLGRIMTKLRETSETTIALIFMIINLEKILRDLFFVFLGMCLHWSTYMHTCKTWTLKWIHCSRYSSLLGYNYAG